MEELNIMLIILQKCKAVDIRFVNRCLNVRNFLHKTVIVAKCKKCKRVLRRNNV